MSKPSTKRTLKSRFFSLRSSTIRGAALLGATALSATILSGCLERPAPPIEPKTSNVFVRKIVNTEIDKIDLLFVVDNSVSMADKQAILEKAVPQMVTRLVTPDCVNEDKTVRQAGTVNAEGVLVCPSADLAPEFQPIGNIHIGVITSSLGGHGSALCLSTDGNPADETAPHGNDRARLIPEVRKNTATNPGGVAVSYPPYNPTFPFLVWRPRALEGQSVGETDRTQLIDDFKAQVVAAGETGCGLEAPLEAWYRFLVDPTPPANIVNIDGQSVMENNAVDQGILDQRAAFLRPDSLVAIILLTDENDCSIMDGGAYYANAGLGWAITNVANGGTFFKSTSACETNPNDPCCFTCAPGSTAPAECVNKGVAAECEPDRFLPEDKDIPNVRCFQQKRRFGIDLLYPTQRYVDALRNTRIPDARYGVDAELVANPLLVGKDNTQRDPSFVFFAGIVGVPWQDLATEETLNEPAQLKYLKAGQLAEANVTVAGQAAKVSRWDLLLGTPGLAFDSRICTDTPSDPRCLSGKKNSAGKSCIETPADPACVPVAPLDPFMIETTEQRTAGATNPITGDKISTPAEWNAINGHEYTSGAGDLQYACIFSLEDFGGVKTDCTATQGNCDCGSDTDRPLCQTGAGASVTKTQSWGKAYPGSRILQVLKDFGDNAIVASICPKVAGVPVDDVNYGYNPAVGAIVDRLAEKLGGSCLPRKLKVDDSDNVPCKIVEALPSAVDCNKSGRAVVKDEKLLDAVRVQLDELSLCGDKTGTDCKAWNMCEIVRVVEADLGTCQNEKNYPDGLSAGYCYIDPAQGLGNEALVSQCDATQKQQLRFVDNDSRDNDKIPLKGAVTLVACTAEQVIIDGKK